MKINRIIAAALSLIMTAGAAYRTENINKEKTFSAAAAESYVQGTYSYLTYRRYSDHVEIIGFDQSAAAVVIPRTIDGLPVTVIGDSAFNSCSGITSVIMPYGVKSIESNAFSYCINLTSITVPTSVVSIGSYAFHGTSWFMDKQGKNPLVVVNDILIDGSGCYGDVVISESVRNIGVWAFYDCDSMTSVTIPSTVKYISDSAFTGCDGLTSVTVPESVTAIGDSAFSSCSALDTITIKNPECDIYAGSYTFTNGYDSDSCQYYFKGTICGYDGSTAQVYAEKYKRSFKSLGEAPPKPKVYGDATGDGLIGIDDVVKILMYTANKEGNPLNGEALDNADVYNRGDGVLISDSLSVQKKLAQIIDTLPES